MKYCKISLKPITRPTRHPGYLDAEVKKLFGTTRVSLRLEFTRSQFDQESVKFVDGMSISGMQQKLSLSLTRPGRLEPVTEGGQYILKPSPTGFPHAAENEHLAMLTSKELMIETAQCGLLQFADGELVYIVKRFDRRADGTKTHQEDLLQGFNDKSVKKYDRSYEEAALLVDRMTNGKKAAVLDLLVRVIHAYVIDNADMHLKNISLLRLPDNRSQFYDKLTPNYDCLITGAFPNYSRLKSLALDLLADEKKGTFSNHYMDYGYYTGHDFLELAKRLGLLDKPIRKAVAAMHAKRDNLIGLIDRCFMPRQMKVSAKESIRARLKAVCTGLV